MITTVKPQLWLPCARLALSDHLWQWKNADCFICSCYETITYNGGFLLPLVSLLSCFLSEVPWTEFRYAEVQFVEKAFLSFHSPSPNTIQSPFSASQPSPSPSAPPTQSFEVNQIFPRSKVNFQVLVLSLIQNLKGFSVFLFLNSLLPCSAPSKWVLAFISVDN